MVVTPAIVIGAMAYFSGKEIIFLEDCGPIPKGSRGLCISYCSNSGAIRLWLLKTIMGVNEFVISRKHIKKLRAF